MTRFRCYWWANISGVLVNEDGEQDGETVVWRLRADDGREVVVAVEEEDGVRLRKKIKLVGSPIPTGLRVEVSGCVAPGSTPQRILMTHATFLPYGAADRITQRRADREGRTYDEVRAEEDDTRNPAA